MKKTLMLGLLLRMGISASAAAVNPFTDVPAGHWSYTAVERLAAAGIIDGYGNGSFGGDRLMTRYEMAQIVAKAMAKGANVDRLATEFAEELDGLGVRVAVLEQKTDQVQIAGQIRTSYAAYSKGAARMFKSNHSGVMRSRLFLTGKVNDNWNYQGVLQNIQDFTNDSGDEKTEFQRAFLEGRIGNVRLTLGRYHSFVADGNLYDHRVDGMKMALGKELKAELEYGKLAYADGAKLGDKFYRFTLSGKTGAWNWEGNYINIDNLLKLGGQDDKIWTLGARVNLDKAYASAMYLKSDVNVADKDAGYVLGIGYAGARQNEAGSWGVWSKYYNQPSGADIMHTMPGVHPETGFKGWGFGADYTIARNMILDTEYYALKDQRDIANNKYNTWWTHLMILF